MPKITFLSHIDIYFLHNICQLLVYDMLRYQFGTNLTPVRWAILFYKEKYKKWANKKMGQHLQLMV